MAQKHILVVFNLMHLAEAASIIWTRGEIEDEVYLVNIGPEAQAARITQASRLLFPNLRSEPWSEGFADSFVSRIDLRDSRIPLDIYELCGPETAIRVYGSDSMAFYPVADNAMENVRADERWSIRYQGLLEPFGSLQRNHAICDDAIHAVMRVIGMAMDPSQTLSTPGAPYVVVPLQYPEYFLRQRGLTADLLSMFFLSTIRSCLDKGYHVLVKPHYRHDKALTSLAESDDRVTIQTQLVNWPLEYLIPMMSRRPAAIVGHWSTSLWSIPHLWGTPAFTDKTETYLRYLEKWKDPQNTKFALYLHSLYSPDLSMLPPADAWPDAAASYASWLAQHTCSRDHVGVGVAGHIKFTPPTRSRFERLRSSHAEWGFPAGLFNSTERRRLMLFASGEYEVFMYKHPKF